MSVLNSKYQNYYSNNITKVYDKNSNNISFKESSNSQINYPIKSNKAQNKKSSLTTHIKIDLSKYNNNSNKELNNNNPNNENIQRIRTITSNRDNIYHKNKISNNESKSRYINRSTRRISQKDTKVKYKKIYINLNKDKNAKQDFNINNNKYSTNNTYIAKNNNNNFILNTQNLKNNNISKISNTYSNKTNNNIVFNNKRINYIKNQSNDNNKTKERENYYKNNNTNTNNELNRIENIYLNIHNNNVIKNNNNILIKQNEIHDIIKENNKDKNIINDKINPEDIKEEENIIDDDEDDIQENLSYDKNSNKINENIYSNINQEYLQKYFNDNQKIEEGNNLIKNTKLNTNYMDYIKNEERKLNNNRNVNNICKNLNLQKQIKNERPNNEGLYDTNNKNDMLDSGTSSSISNTIKFQGMYNNFYGKTNNKDISIRESTNIKNEKVFKNLIPKNSFQKFLTSKIKYYMNEESIPKKFISEFIHQKNPLKNSIHKKIISDTHKSHHEDIKFDFSTFNAYYENGNIISEIKRSKSKKNKKPKSIMIEENNELMNKINELKEYIDNSKIEMEQRDNKLKTYLQSFERLNTENENIISEIKRSKSKNNKKPKVIVIEENKELMNKINELREYIDNSKIEMEQRDNKLKTCLKSFDRLNTENEENKKRIENLEYELKSKNYEVEEKRNEILELNNINNNLEIEMQKLKEEYINETINNREAKENYLIIKNNYNDMKNQFDLLNIKYKTLSDENYNFKRDKMLYEKELKSKNTMIDDLIEDNSNKKKLKGQLNKLELNKIEEKEIKQYLSSNKKERKIKREESIEKQNLKEIKKKETFFEKLNIDELMNLRDELIGERTFMTNEFYKIPVKATNKQYERRNELEQGIAQINNKLAKIRIRINILKESKNNKYI